MQILKEALGHIDVYRSAPVQPHPVYLTCSNVGEKRFLNMVAVILNANSVTDYTKDLGKAAEVGQFPLGAPITSFNCSANFKGQRREHLALRKPLRDLMSVLFLIQ